MIKKRMAVQQFKFEDKNIPKVAIAPYNIIHRTIGRACAKKLLHTWVKPNHVTMFDFFLGTICAYLFYRGDYASIVIAAICIHGVWILDGIDGKLARIKNMCSSYGEWLDDVVGTYTWIFINLGLTFGVYNQVQKPHVLVFGFLVVVSILLKNFIQETFFKVFKFSNEYGKSLYKNLGMLMFFRFGGLFNIIIISLGAFFNKLYWVLIFLGAYGPVYNLAQTTILTLKARKEHLRERAKSSSKQ